MKTTNSILLLVIASALAGCSTGPAGFYPAAPALVRVLSTGIADFKDTGTVRSYPGSRDAVWPILVRFAEGRKSVDGGKVIMKNQAEGWIMTERKMGWFAAAHDVYFLERQDADHVRIEVVSRTPAGASGPIDPARAAELHSALAAMFNRPE